jgi:formylglycine-generating enzyme required for sulfatase activity
MIIGDYAFFPGGTVAVNDAAFAGGDTPEGIRHLVGNVSEWTQTASTCRDLYDCPSEWDAKTRVAALEVRGFGWVDDYRDSGSPVPIAVPNSMASDTVMDSLGFRCASDP